VICRWFFNVFHQNVLGVRQTPSGTTDFWVPWLPWISKKPEILIFLIKKNGLHDELWRPMEALGYGVRMRLRPEFPRRFIVTLSPGRGLNKRQNAKQKKQVALWICNRIFRMFVSLKFKSLGGTVPKYLWWCHWKNLKWSFFNDGLGEIAFWKTPTLNL